MHMEMHTARDMDAVIDQHERFLDTCLKECLLASQDLLKILTKIMTTCLLFADQMKRFSESGDAVSTTPLDPASKRRSTGGGAVDGAAGSTVGDDKGVIPSGVSTTAARAVSSRVRRVRQKGELIFFGIDIHLYL